MSARMELQSRIGLRVQALRKERGLTQERLAEAIGKSVDTVSLLERGRIMPTIDTLLAASKCLGVNLASLISSDGEADPNSGEADRMRSRSWAILAGMNERQLRIAVEQLASLVQHWE